MSPYQVTCSCGRTLRGERLPRHQVVPCAACGRGVFVLPASPFDRLTPPTNPSSVWKAWRAPLVAAALCAGLVLTGFALAWPYLSRPERHQPRSETAGTGGALALLDAGRGALAEGKFHVACGLLQTASEQAAALPTPRRGELLLLWRQADLLARLCPRSLEEIVAHARLVRDADEWTAQFARDYHGRTVVLDDAIRRDDEGRPRLVNHVFEADDELVRLALEDLTVLADLPLEDGPRLVFGARLARCQREEGGWVIRFDPQSGVLLTDMAAVEACFPGPVDPAVRAALERQRRWLQERSPALPPAP